MPDTKDLTWIGCDLDGTLAYHDPEYFSPLEIGEPVPMMLATIKKHLKDGDTIKIVTARVGVHPDHDEDVDEIKEAIQDWTEEHLGQRLEVTDSKDYNMLYLYDDRARQVIPNTGVTMGMLVGALRRKLEELGDNPNYSEDVEAHLDKEGS